MTQPPGGYPPDYGEQHPPPADPFFGPPSWDPPTPPTVPSQPLQHQPPQHQWHLPAPAPPPYRPSTGPYPSRRSRHNRRRGLMIALLVLGTLVVLAAGGGVATWLLTRDTDRNGADDPILAVQSFLQAVYREQDPAAASAQVCSEARDQDALAGKIEELRTYQQAYSGPSFRWSQPSVVDQTDELAVVDVTVTMTTQDEKTANQQLRLSVLDKGGNGWWVCDVQTVEATEPTPTPPAPSPEGE